MMRILHYLVSCVYWPHPLSAGVANPSLVYVQFEFVLDFIMHLPLGCLVGYMLFKITGKGYLGSWMIFQGFYFTVHCPMNEYAALMVICPPKQKPIMLSSIYESTGSRFQAEWLTSVNNGYEILDVQIVHSTFCWFGDIIASALILFFYHKACSEFASN